MNRNLNKIHTKLIISISLILIAFFAFYVRSSSLYETYVNADDPYLVYRIAEYFRQNYSLPDNDTLRLYPYGWQYFGRRDHLLWYYIAGIFSVFFDKIIGLTNPTTFAVHFYPPFFAFLTTFVMFFVSYEIFKDWRVALITSLIFATLPATIYRTNSSFADKEPIASLFMMLSYYFYVKSLSFKSKKSYVFALFSGIFLALMAMTWGGAEIVITSYILFAFLALILGLMNKHLIFIHSLVTLTAYLLILFGPAGYFRWFSPNNLINYMIIISSFLYLALEKIGVTKKIKNKYISKNPVLTIFIVLVVMTLIIVPLHPITKREFQNLMDRIREPLVSLSVVASTVAENRPSSYGELVTQTGPLLALRVLNLPIGISFFINNFLFAVLGIFIIVYEFLESKLKNSKHLFVIAWFIVFVWAGLGAVRLVYLSGYIISIVSAFFLIKLYQFLISHKTFGRYTKLFVIIIIILVLSINTYAGFVFGSSLRPGMSKSWEDALLWIKENSNKTDVILSWWDYGYIIQYYAQRPTYVDPGHPSWIGDKTLWYNVTKRDQLVAKFFTSTNESEYLDWLKSINVRYIVHDISMIGKYSAVSTIASDGQYTDILQIFPYQGSACLEQVNNTCTKIVNRYGPIWIVFTNETIQPVYVSQNIPTNISKICTQNGIIEIDPNGIPGCVVIYNNAIAYLGIRCYTRGGCEPYDLGNTIFAQMWFLDAQTLQHFRKVYDNGEVKVFEVIY